MVEDKYQEALNKGMSLLETGTNLTGASKYFLQARSYATTDEQHFQAIFGHAKVLKALGEFKEIARLMQVVDGILSQGTDDQRAELTAIKAEMEDAATADKTVTGQKKAADEAAVKAAGGVRPDEPKFIATITARADQLVEGGWEHVEQVFKDSFREKTVLKLASKMAPVRGPESPKAGGIPYSEAGDKWPDCAVCKKPMQFYFQINCQDGPHSLPAELGLTVIYMCAEDGTNYMEPSTGTWAVRNYLEPSAEKFVPMKINDDLLCNKREWFLEQNTRHKSTAPQMEVLPDVAPELFDLLQKLYAPDTRRCYDRLSTHFNKRLKEKGVTSDFVVGGYPNFYNGEFVARDQAGKPMIYVWTISSLDDYFNFCDNGYLSLYYSPELKQFRMFIETT